MRGLLISALRGIIAVKESSIPQIRATIEDLMVFGEKQREGKWLSEVSHWRHAIEFCIASSRRLVYDLNDQLSSRSTPAHITLALTLTSRKPGLDVRTILIIVETLSEFAINSELKAMMRTGIAVAVSQRVLCGASLGPVVKILGELTLR